MIKTLFIALAIISAEFVIYIDSCKKKQESGITPPTPITGTF